MLTCIVAFTLYGGSTTLVNAPRINYIVEGSKWCQDGRLITFGVDSMVCVKETSEQIKQQIERQCK